MICCQILGSVVKWQLFHNHYQTIIFIEICNDIIFDTFSGIFGDLVVKLKSANFKIVHMSKPEQMH